MWGSTVLHPDQGGHDVELENSTEVDRVQLFDGHVEALARVVDQDIDPAECLDRACHQAIELLGHRDVGGDGERARELPGQRLESVDRRAASTMRAPRPLSRRAVAAPMPEDAPVTIQTLQSISMAGYQSGMVR